MTGSWKTMGRGEKWLAGFMMGVSFLSLLCGMASVWRSIELDRMRTVRYGRHQVGSR